MSLKDLFSNKDKSNSVTPELLANNALELQRGRSPLLAELGKKNQQFTPILDFSKPENFARYGSAKDYYTYSISRVYNEYPYDGSLQERLEWENHSTYLDDYIFDNQYPRQNGFIYISPKGWGTRASVSPFGDVGLPTDTDYILIKGGPNNDPDYKVTDALSKANIYDTARDRGSSLKLDLSTGSTVEFWLKIPALVATNLTEGELIFDLWNGVTSSRGDYGRLSIWLNNHTSASFSGSAFAVECASGALGSETGFTIGGSGVYSSPAIFPTVPDSSIADNKWHHYAFALENSGTAIQATMYRDGAFVLHGLTSLILERLILPPTLLDEDVQSFPGQLMSLGTGKQPGPRNKLRTTGLSLWLVALTTRRLMLTLIKTTLVWVYITNLMKV